MKMQKIVVYKGNIQRIDYNFSNVWKAGSFIVYNSETGEGVIDYGYTTHYYAMQQLCKFLHKKIKGDGENLLEYIFGKRYKRYSEVTVSINNGYGYTHYTKKDF